MDRRLVAVHQFLLEGDWPELG